MSEYLIQDTTLTDIADAIRSKTGGSALINPEDMASEIEGISSGGYFDMLDLADASLWGNKDFSSSSPVGTSYDDTRTASSSRISLKEPLPIKEVTIVHKTASYDVFALFYDAQKNYIGWCFDGWRSSAVCGIREFITKKLTDSLPFTDAVYFGLAIRKPNNQAVSAADAVTSKIKIYWGDITQ